MIGILFNSLACIEAEYQLVLAKTTIPDSTLKKKSQSIAYRMIKEDITRDE